MDHEIRSQITLIKHEMIFQSWCLIELVATITSYVCNFVESGWLDNYVSMDT